MFLFSLFYFKFDIFPLAHSKIHNDNSQTFNLSLDRELGLFVVVCVCSHSLSLCVSSLSLSFCRANKSPYFGDTPHAVFSTCSHVFSHLIHDSLAVLVVVADVMSPS